MTAYIVILGTGAYGDFGGTSLCYCSDEETSKRAVSLLTEDYEAAEALWEEKVASGNPYSGTDALAGRIIPTRVPTVPMYYSCLYDGFSLAVEEIPEWE